MTVDGIASVTIEVTGVVGGGSGAVESVNGRTGAVTGLAEASSVTTEANTRAAADTALDARLDVLEAGPSWTPIAGADAKTPSQLTMRVVNAARSRDPLPSSGPFVPLIETFTNDDLFLTRWEDTTLSGTVSSETYTNGKLTVTATAGGALSRTYWSRTALCSPNGVFACAKIEPGWAGSSGANVGFFNSAGTTGVYAYWNLSTGATGIGSVGSLSGSASGTTRSGPTTGTGPQWIGILLAWPEALLMISDDGINWRADAKAAISGLSMLDPTVFSLYHPTIWVNPAASGTVIISSFRAGYAGALGYRDQKPITYADGTPIQRDGRYYMTVTFAHGSGFKSNHMGIIAVDPVSYQVEVIGHLFWRLTGTGTGAGYGGQAVYDDDTGEWHILANSWGFDDVSTGVDIIYATTTRDLLSPGVHCLKADRLTGLSSYSLYDCSLRRDANDVWQVAAIETDVRTNWTTGNHPVLFSGASLTTLSRVTSDATAPVDGTCWAKIGGSWYILGGGSTSFLAWDANLANKTTLTTWSSALPSGLITFGSFMAHPGTVVVDDGDRTRYLVVTYDNSLINSWNATKGGAVVLEADEKPNGQEFEPRRFR